jgi:hypothetical protein
MPAGGGAKLLLCMVTLIKSCTIHDEYNWMAMVPRRRKSTIVAETVC